MSVALRGNLQDFGIADVFQLIGQQNKTGLLEIQAGPQSMRLAFDEGRVVWAAPAGSSEEAVLAEKLVRSGLISSQKAGELLGESEASARPLGAVAVASGAVSSVDLDRTQETITQDTIFEVLRFQQGSFDFSAQRVAHDRPAEKLLAAEQILMDGLRMVDEWQTFAALVPSGDTLFEPAGSDPLVAVDLLELLAQHLRARGLVHQVADPLAEAVRRPTQVGLEDLSDVHARRHAERIQADVDRAAVGQVGHVLFRKDPRDHTLVAVATGHLVAHRELAFDGDVDLHHLEHARRQLVALLESGDLLVEHRPDHVRRAVFDVGEDTLHLILALCGLVGHLDVAVQRRSGHLGQGWHGVTVSPVVEPGLPAPCARRRRALAAVLPFQEQIADLRISALSPDDADLVLLVLAQPLDLLLLRSPSRARPSRRRGARTPVRRSPIPDTPGGTRNEVSRTSPAFSPKMARSRRSSGESCVSPLGVILPTRMSSGLHLGADAHDARLVEIGFSASSPTFGNVAGDLFLAELGVAGDALELLDVDRGERDRP